VRNPEAERFVREVWAVFQRDGIPGVLALAPTTRAGRRIPRTVGRADPVVARGAFTALHRDGERL
jgi:hypothetical protein